MQLLLQSNRWSCMPTAFAMCCNCLPKAIIDHCGHDGSEILWPELPEPLCRRGFHIQEMIDYVIYSGYSIAEIEPEPRNVPYGTCDWETYERLSKPVYTYHCQRLSKYLERFNGVLLGITAAGLPHAVAWSSDDSQILDPLGHKSTLNDFAIERFFAVYR